MGALDVFTYVVSEKVGLYRRVVDALAAAKSRYRIQLRVDEVAHLIRENSSAAVPPEEELTAALDQLTVWGNLRRTQDVRAVATLTEFYHRRSLYQLTPAGEQAHRGVLAVDNAIGASGGRLSAVMLPAIMERIEALRAELGSPEPDAVRLYTLLKELHDYSGELAENARRFMNDLADALNALSITDAGFLAYKRAILAYLQGFVAVLDQHQPRILAAIVDVERAGVPRMIEFAATADEAPGRDGTRRGPVQELTSRWDALRVWFAGSSSEPAEAEHLRQATLDAIARILLILERLNEQRFLRVNRTSDFMRLATWFAGAPNGDEAHRLFARAFGLHSARHFQTAVEDEDLGRGRSWLEAPPVEIAPRLRATGRRGTPGRPGTIADYHKAKLASLAEMRMRQARIDRAARRFLDRSQRLSELGRLGREEFRLLLDLLAAALQTQAGPNGTRQGTTPSGQFTVTLEPLEATALAEITCPDGRLLALDLVLQVQHAATRRQSAGSPR